MTDCNFNKCCWNFNNNTWDKVCCWLWTREEENLWPKIKHELVQNSVGFVGFGRVKGWKGGTYRTWALLLTLFFFCIYELLTIFDSSNSWNSLRSDDFVAEITRCERCAQIPLCYSSWSSLASGLFKKLINYKRTWQSWINHIKDLITRICWIPSIVSNISRQNKN